MTLQGVLTSLIWLIPYLVSGFSAPIIFKNISDPRMAGHIAGSLFIFAAVWALYLSSKFQMPLSIKIFFSLTLILQLIFWGWRFFNSTPLKESVLLGVPGPAWHGVLTSFYLLSAALIVIFLVKLQK